MYIINNMYLMKDNILIRLKCMNCEHTFFKKINTNNLFCTKDCKSSFKLKKFKLKKNRSINKN